MTLFRVFGPPNLFIKSGKTVHSSGSSSTNVQVKRPLSGEGPDICWWRNDTEVSRPSLSPVQRVHRILPR